MAPRPFFTSARPGWLPVAIIALSSCDSGDSWSAQTAADDSDISTNYAGENTTAGGTGNTNGNQLPKAPPPGTILISKATFETHHSGEAAHQMVGNHMEDIWLMRADGSNPRVLYQGPDHEELAGWCCCDN